MLPDWISGRGLVRHSEELRDNPPSGVPIWHVSSALQIQRWPVHRWNIEKGLVRQIIYSMNDKFPFDISKAVEGCLWYPRIRTCAEDERPTKRKFQLMIFSLTSAQQAWLGQAWGAQQGAGRTLERPKRRAGGLGSAAYSANRKKPTVDRPVVLLPQFLGLNHWPAALIGGNFEFST